MDSKVNTVFFLLLAIAIILIGSGSIIQSKRIKTNERLVNELHQTMEDRKHATLVNSAVLLTFMQDPYLVQVWNHSIYNPFNQPYVLEISAALGIPHDSITQLQFDQRYLIDIIQSE